MSAAALANQGIHMYHYCHLFPWQVRQKALIYRFEKARPHMVEWAQLGFFQLKWPYRVHEVYRLPSWLQRFEGEHPPSVVEMMEDARAGKITAELRDTEDIERLLGRWWYGAGIEALRAAEPINRAYHSSRSHAGRARRSIKRMVSPQLDAVPGE